MRVLKSLLLAVVLPFAAFAFGPVVEGGVVVTLPQVINSVTIAPLVGPRFLVAFEVGERFNHEIGFEFTRVSGAGVGNAISVPVSVLSLAGRYTFSVDILKKQGLTPLVGAGLAIGQALIDVGSQHTTGVWLAFHAVAGARYTFNNGLGLKLQVAISTHGGFVGIEPSLAAAWRF